jgi:hypothetical protein
MMAVSRGRLRIPRVDCERFEPALQLQFCAPADGSNNKGPRVCAALLLWCPSPPIDCVATEFVNPQFTALCRSLRSTAMGTKVLLTANLCKSYMGLPSALNL